MAVTNGWDGLNLAAFGGKVNKFSGEENGSSQMNRGRLITIGELPQAYVNAHGDMVVSTPKGVKMPLREAYKNYGGTHVYTDDVPGLTDYLTTQAQPDIATVREVKLAQQRRANERFNNSVDAAAIGLMSIPGLVPVAGTVLPLLAPGTVGGTLIGEAAGGMAMGEGLNYTSKALTGRDWGENVRYGLEGTADILGLGYNPNEWSSFGRGVYNFLTDLTNPGYYRGDLLKSAVNATTEGIG